MLLLRDELAEKKLAAENSLASLEKEVSTIEKMKEAAENDALNAAEKITSLGMIITISTESYYILLSSYNNLEEEIFTMKKTEEGLEEEISGIA